MMNPAYYLMPEPTADTPSAPAQDLHSDLPLTFQSLPTEAVVPALQGLPCSWLPARHSYRLNLVFGIFDGTEAATEASASSADIHIALIIAEVHA